MCLTELSQALPGKNLSEMYLVGIGCPPTTLERLTYSVNLLAANPSPAIIIFVEPPYGDSQEKDL